MVAMPIAKPPEPGRYSTQGRQLEVLKRDWIYYEIALKIDKEEGPVRVAHLLNVISRGGQEMLETFCLSDGDRADIKEVLQEFGA